MKHQVNNQMNDSASLSSLVARRRQRTRRMAEGAIIAALYVALTWVSNLAGLASLAVQVRLSDALCALTFFTPAAVPGLFVGCLLANLSMGSPLWDILGGSLATLLGAVGGWLLGMAARRCLAGGRRIGANVCKALVPLPTVVANTVIVPFVLVYAYGLEGTVPWFMLTVGAGEVVSAWILGLVLLYALERKPQVFMDSRR